MNKDGVRNKVGKETDVVRKRKPTFFGHVLCMNDNRLTKRILI